MKYIIDEYELGKHILESGQMPGVIVRDEDEFQAIVAPILQAQAQAQQADTMETEATAINKSSKAPEPNSPAEALVSQGA